MKALPAKQNPPGECAARGEEVCLSGTARARRVRKRTLLPIRKAIGRDAAQGEDVFYGRRPNRSASGIFSDFWVKKPQWGVKSIF